MFYSHPRSFQNIAHHIQSWKEEVISEGGGLHVLLCDRALFCTSIIITIPRNYPDLYINFSIAFAPQAVRIPILFLNPFVPTVAFSQLSSNICCPRDCVSRHNGGTSGAPLKPLRDDSVLRALSSLRGLRGAPAVPPLCRETQSLGQQMLNATVGKNEVSRLCTCCSRYFRGP